MHTDTIRNKLQKVKLLLLDVDGVLTDGSIIYSDEGREIKIFNAKDGFGIRLLMATGIHVGIVTGRRSEALNHRCRNLGIRLKFDGVKDKAALLSRVLKETGVDATEVAFIGDDLPDLPLMNRVGLAVAVADAPPEVRKRVDLVTHRSGGSGAVREVCEAILKAQGHWEGLMVKYSQ